ncbi:MAG TPA: ATP-dependent helicase, partial [Polyangiaceae bacterium]|nr:ATP-dependent helicase [Polyangiaceae bacterium]
LTPIESTLTPIESTLTQSSDVAPFPLNEVQLRVVKTGTKPVVVSAGPGTGKTRTLTERIVHQIRAGVWKGEQVLALTFTNQATAELATRLEDSLGVAGQSRPLVTTFHGFGKMVLETIFGQTVSIAEDETREALMGRVLGPEASKRRTQEMLEAVSLAKQSPHPLAAIGDDEIRSTYLRYQQLLEQQSLCDLDDLVLTAYTLLSNDTLAAAHLAERFVAVCVDEYQDINDVQAALIRLLSPSGHNLLVIGDPDQAIYGFRGARPGHFTRFSETYVEAQSVSLDTSYRLSRPILNVAQAMLGQKRPLSATKSGPKVEIVACPTDASEAEQLLVRIEQLMGGSSHFAIDTGRAAEAEEPDLGFGDIAILSRLKTQRASICAALSRSAIPCLMLGEDEPHDPRSEKIAIMTMHASKGREFEVVFVVGVEQGLMPLALDGLNADPEEERRLMYVAATRAKRRLIISYTGHRVVFGKTLPGLPSPLLSNLPLPDVSFRTAAMPQKPHNRQLSLF